MHRFEIFQKTILSLNVVNAELPRNINKPRNKNHKISISGKSSKSIRPPCHVTQGSYGKLTDV